jgi:ribosome modulation factor
MSNNHLLGCANKGYEARIAGKPCEHPYAFTSRAKGLFRQRVQHWEGGWKEADEKIRQGRVAESPPAS